MANGERCIHCREQETQHEHSEPWASQLACDRFESEVSHHEDCPVLDCNGDCEATIARAHHEADLAYRRASFRNFVAFDGSIIQVDVGT